MRSLKLARLRLRDGRKDEAKSLAARALGLAPGMRLSWWRIRLSESLGRR